MVKRALCVGIDQVRMSGVPRLQGCCGDARAVKRLLSERFGFHEVAELLNQQATKEACLRSLDWLARASAPGDSVVVFVASYGSWFPQQGGQDGESLDEIIVVYDHDWQWNMLRDDEVALALARFHPQVSISCVFDTCHSGAMGNGIRCLTPPRDVPHVAYALQRGLLVRPRFQYRRPEDNPGVLFFGACAPHESAVEVPMFHGFAGAFTMALTDLLGGLSADVSWDQAQAWLTHGMQSHGIRQTPQLHGPPQTKAQRAFGGLASSSGATSAQGGWSAMSGPPSQGPAWGQGLEYGPVSVASPGLSPGWQGSAPAGYGQAPAVAFHQNAPPVSSYAQPLPQPAQPLVVTPPQAPVITPVDKALADFSDSDYTVRLCNGVFSIVPFVSRSTPYVKVADALEALQPNAPAHLLAKAQAHAKGEPVAKTLWVASAIDTGDAGIAVYSGIKSAVGLFMGGKSNALETDPQQAVDASLKLLAISYMVYRLFPGSMGERVQLFYQLPAGQSMAAYYAAVEVALPFADNAVAAGGHFLHNLMSRYGNDASSKLSSTVGKDAVEGSQGVLASLMAPMEGIVQKVVPLARQIAETASRHVPTGLNVADKVAGVVATGADALPVYRYLGARLTAEACAAFAIRGIPAA